MLVQTPKQLRHAAVPLVPIVSSGDCVEFILKPRLSSSAANFLLAGSKPSCSPQVRKKYDAAGRSRQNKRIVLPPMITSPSAKNGRMRPVLADSPDRQLTAGHIDGGTDSSSKSEEIGVFQRESDGAKASHRNPTNASIRAIAGRRESALHIGNEIVDDVIFEAVVPAGRGIDIV